MTRIIAEIRLLADILTKPSLLFYALPWLMLMLVMGTVSQRYIGLYQSQKLFFGSFIFRVGIIPLPGAYAAIGLIALALCAKLILKSPLRKHHIGIIIAHASVLVLLAGGLITAISREEGYLVLGDNEASHVVSDYHDRELAILKNGELLQKIPYTELSAGKGITDARMPFSVRILSYCFNCNMEMHGNSDPAVHDMAARFAISALTPEREDAKNQSGVVFEVAGNAGKAKGTYLTSQALNKQPEFSVGKDRYQVFIRQAERDIPFDLRLIKFTKSDYPGTDMARSYQSEVEVIDGALKWKTVIEMNQPLRYRGYTLYQSSFAEQDGKLFTVLAVVKNSGEIFPYLAISSLCVGLVIHLVTTFLLRRKAA